MKAIPQHRARLRTRLTKTPVACGDLLTKVGTKTEAQPFGDVYRLDSWKLHVSPSGAATGATLYVVPDTVLTMRPIASLGKPRGKQPASLDQFGLELYEWEPR